MTEIVGQKQSAPASGSALESFKWLVAIGLLAIAVVGNSYFSAHPLLYRVLGIVVLAAVAAGIAATTVRGKWVITLFREARAELRRVVWPTRQETLQTTFGVVVMVIVVALFLGVLDWLLNRGISSIIS